MKKLAFLIVAAVVPMLNAAPVLQLSWDIDGKNATTTNPLAATVNGPNVSAGSITLGSGVPAANVPNAFRGSPFDQLSLATAISTNDYLSLSVTNSGTLSFERLDFRLATGTGGTLNWNLMSSKTGFTTADSLYSGSNNSSTATQFFQVDLTGVALLQNTSSATEFRIYAYRAAAGNSQFGYQSDGTSAIDVAVYAIPEPSSIILLMGFGVVGSLVLRTRVRENSGA